MSKPFKEDNNFRELGASCDIEVLVLLRCDADTVVEMCTCVILPRGTLAADASGLIQNDNQDKTTISSVGA